MDRAHIGKVFEGPLFPGVLEISLGIQHLQTEGEKSTKLDVVKICLLCTVVLSACCLSFSFVSPSLLPVLQHIATQRKC